MKVLKIVLTVLGVLILLAGGVYFFFLKPSPPAISQEDRQAIHLLPLPNKLTLTSTELNLEKGLYVDESQIENERLREAITRFSNHINLNVVFGGNSEDKIPLNFIIKDVSGAYPSLEMKEGYQLDISEIGITISSDEIWGAMRALETLKQLTKEKNGKLILTGANIEDSPRFPWRGLMIDVCRHWVPKNVVLENIEAMAAAKLNVFHWHLTEYQGFRVESKVFPKLHELGSGGNYYTQEEIKEVIEYAADRGIRVVPEFDLPGHATSWLVGYPELASAKGPYEIDTVLIGIFKPLLDPTKEEVYQFLDEFLGEMSSLFPDKYIHLGGDEVNPAHWNENPSIQAFIKEKGLEDNHGLQAYFNKRMSSILQKHKRTMVGWDEILHPDLSKENTLIQSWRSHESLWEAARMGFESILSQGYYLDHKYPAGYHYNHDPLEIKGGITIDIDSSYWQSWDITILFNETEIHTTLYLFGEEPVNGILISQDGRQLLGVDSVKIEGSNYSFDVESSVGKITWNLDNKGDSLVGTASVAIMNLNAFGKKIGGSDVPKSSLPSFKKIEPLDEQQTQRVLGGEACMWSEMVDATTINSRIWPRTGAVAERLWSDPQLANDEDDLYRRLWKFDAFLATNTTKHYERLNSIASTYVSSDKLESFLALAELLEEVQFFGRMELYPDNVITASIQLNGLVDVARPESKTAYDFGKVIDEWIAQKDQSSKDILITYLEGWINTQKQLLDGEISQPLLMEAKPHAQHLLKLSEALLPILQGNERLSSEQRNAILVLAKEAQIAKSGVILKPVEHFEKLINSL